MYFLAYSSYRFSDARRETEDDTVKYHSTNRLLVRTYDARSPLINSGKKDFPSLEKPKLFIISGNLRRSILQFMKHSPRFFMEKTLYKQKKCQLKP